MKTNKLLILAFACIALLFNSCNKSEDETTSSDVFTLGANVSRSFTGTIVDSNSNPLANVAINMSGVTTTTDAEGNFTLNNVSVKERFAYVTAEKTGFIKGSRVVFPGVDGFSKLQIMLLPATVVATIESGQTSVVALANQTKVTFDGAFMTESGSAYTGNVKIIMNHLDPADPKVFEKMPGNLIGTRTDGSYAGMETYGMIVVEMLGQNNQKLQLMTGHTASLVMPIAPNQLDTAAATIPFWHFNETKGMWEEQGFSRRVGTNYVSNVPHFSWWNNDWAYVPSVLTVIATNFDSTPVNGLRITLTRFAGSTGDVLIDLGVTGANGRLTANTPKNEQLIFRAYTTDGILISEQTLAASDASARTVYVEVPAPNRH
jgi:hypothetical protein